MKLVIFVIGLLIGAVLALQVIETYAIYTPLETHRDVVTALQPQVVNKCSAGLEPLNYSCTLEVTESSTMQPFGRTFEDETTAARVLQPSREDVQVTRNYLYLQPTKFDVQLQGSSPRLQSRLQ